MRRRDKKKLLKIFVILFTVIVLILIADNSIRPLMERIAESKAKIESEKAINDAITDVLTQEKIDYNDLVTLSTMPDGTMASISTNIVNVNSLKAKVSNKILEQMENGEPNELKVALGTLTGSEFLNGRGPKIKLKLSYYGNVFTDLKSNFTSAGINQTRHQIILTVKTSVFIEMPGYNTSTEVQTNFCIAETVIVGNVPSSYTVVNGDDSSEISLVNDYGNQ